MDNTEEHYENLEKSTSELRWFFEERGHEIEMESKVEVASKTMSYTIVCGNYAFKCSTTLMKDYSALDKIWECYKKTYCIFLEEMHYEWVDSDRLEGLMKLLHT